MINSREGFSKVSELWILSARALDALVKNADTIKTIAKNSR